MDSAWGTRGGSDEDGEARREVFAALLALGAVGLGVFVYVNAAAWDASMDKVYDVPPMAITWSDDATVMHLGRGREGNR